MIENASTVLCQLNQMRSSWLKTTRENKFEDGIQRLLSDLYPDQAHFIFELLQNAEDACATLVQFHLTKHKLIVSHNGRRLFDQKDVESITSIGQSTKKDDVNQIGKFGIGFKAVFAYSISPQVHSGEFNFKIEDLVCPFEIPAINKNNLETVFVFPFNNPSKPAESCFHEIKTAFESLDHTILLFLNHIDSIEWDLDGGDSGRALREHVPEVDERLIKVCLANSSNKDLQEDAWFLRFQDILEDHGNLKCSIALQLGFRKENQIDLDIGEALSEQMKVIPADGKLCVFFPAAKETTGLKVHVNGPYAATIDRASIQHDHEDNQTIFYATACLFIEAMEHLKSSGLLIPEFLNVLPNEDDKLSSFYSVLKDVIYDALRDRKLVPTLGGDYVKATELARGLTAITDVINEDGIKVLFKRDRKYWAAGVMRHGRSDKLLDSLDIPYWGYQDLIETINDSMSNWCDESVSEWLLSKNDSWLTSFYILLLKAANQVSRTFDIIGWRVIKTEAGELLAGGEVYLPVEGEPLASELPTVSVGLFEGLEKGKKERLLEFLNVAGVQQIGECEKLQKILDSYYLKEAGIPANERHLEHIKRFIKWYEKENETGLFQKYYIFKDLKEEKFCRGSKTYIDKPFEDTGLGAIYSDGSGQDSARSALWLGYVKLKNFIQFAQDCGAQKALEIKRTQVHENPRKSELYSGTGGARVTYTGTNEDYNIVSLVGLISQRNVGIARLVWRTLAGVKPYMLKARYRPNQQHDVRSVPSSLVQVLQSIPWIPGNDGKFYFPRDMSKKQLREDFEYDDRNGWLTAIEFARREQEATREHIQQKEIARQLGVTLEDIDFLKMLKKSSGKYENLKRELEANLTSPEFPERPSTDHKRRVRVAKVRVSEAPKKKFGKRPRRVRISSPTGDKSTYLKENYTNDKSQLICQMCEKEMPFRCRNGQYYFEAVQLFDKLASEHAAAHLALCPLCAAKFKELVKRDEKQCQNLHEQMVSSESHQLGLDLGRESGSIRFVEKHFLDVQGILDGEEEQMYSEVTSS